jgi:hypothetical protein
MFQTLLYVNLYYFSFYSCKVQYDLIFILELFNNLKKFQIFDNQGLYESN